MPAIHELSYPGRAMDLARWRMTRGQGWNPHRHRFHEVVWIERGGLEHRIDGRPAALTPGSITWIRAGRVHEAVVTDPQGVVYVNLSVAEADVAGLRQRLGSRFPLWDPAQPETARLPPDAVAGLGRLLSALDPDNGADRDLLLLHLAHLQRAPAEPDTAALPEPLQRGLEALARDGAWEEGVSGLARRSGWSREHTARTVRACLGCAPTELLQGMRLRRVARLLVLDDRPVEELATAFGFQGLSHFYRIFRAAFGVTPAAWRRQRRTGLGLGPSDHARSGVVEP